VDRVDVVGVPYNSAGRVDGVARAPQALRRAGLVEAVAAAGHAVADRGDLELPRPTPERDAESHVVAIGVLAAMVERVRGAVAESLQTRAFPLILGGDCPVLLGCLAAARGSNGNRLLFVDGHEDAWPAERSTTGEAADMELGWLLGRSAELPASLRMEIPTLEAADVIVFGPRDDHELADAAIASIGNIVQIVRPDALAAEPCAVTDSAVSTLSARGSWWLHVDLDVLATDCLIAVDYPQPGGIDWPTLTAITARALASPDVLGWSLTIYNPDLDPDHAGAARIVRYVAEAMRV
jgi:arginase